MSRSTNTATVYNPIQDMKMGFFTSIGTIGALVSVYTLHQLTAWGWGKLFSKSCPVNFQDREQFLNTQTNTVVQCCCNPTTVLTQSQ